MVDHRSVILEKLQAQRSELRISAVVFSPIFFFAETLRAASSPSFVMV